MAWTAQFTDATMGLQMIQVEVTFTNGTTSVKGYMPLQPGRTRAQVRAEIREYLEAMTPILDYYVQVRTFLGETVTL